MIIADLSGAIILDFKRGLLYNYNTMAFVEFQNVTFSYGSGEGAVTAIKNLSFGFEKGDFIALVGHNGSGKSTVARLMNGLLTPTEGSVTVSGLSTADNKNLFDIRRHVGVVFQNPDNQMVASIIEDDIAFGPENLGVPPKEIRERVDWSLEAVGMSEYKKGTPFRLSGGQKQRIAIAGILAIKPDVIVLDEATAMLDPEGRREVMKVVSELNRRGTTIVMITHFMEEAALAKRIMLLNDGELIFDGGREIFSHLDKLNAAGIELPICTSVAVKLKNKGYDISEKVVLPEELAEELCRL